MTKEIRDKIKKYGLKVDHLSKCKEYETLKKLLNEINANLICNDLCQEEINKNHHKLILL